MLQENSDLQEELKTERQKLDTCKMSYEREIASLKEGNMNAGSSSNEEDVPMALREEFVKYCLANKLFPCPTEDQLTVQKCKQVLNQKPMKEEVSESALMERVKGLEDELRLALGAAEDIRALKGKLMQMVERTRQEKESRLKSEGELRSANKKVEMLTDHMEKLMIHLKHEAAAKTRSVEQLRTSERENLRVKEKCDLLSRKSSAKDRLILELREGSKVLEDQLRSMDEKFLELRTKLDWAREQGNKKIKKAEKTAKELRTKFALAGNTNLLDNIALPSIYGDGQSTYAGESGMEASFSGWSAAGSSLEDCPSTHMGKGSGRKSGKNKNQMSMSSSSIFSDGRQGRDDEQEMDYLMEKIRKKSGAKVDWSEDKIRTLTQPGNH